MRLYQWSQDTIARRFATTIGLAVLATMGMVSLFIAFAGPLTLPPIEETGLLPRAADIVRLVEAAPSGERDRLAGVVDSREVHVAWYPASTGIAARLDEAPTQPPPRDAAEFRSEGAPRRTVYFKAGSIKPVVPQLAYDDIKYPDTQFFAVALNDQSWIVFTIPARLWGLDRFWRATIALSCLVMSSIAVSAIATYQLARPIHRFTEAVQRFGSDPRLSSVIETGPRELRAAIGAFNAMQEQIQRFVEDRTSMLAAISHDLRTPLTRMRLRAELIEDGEQRRRLFRDVDDMQAMIESALSFFRDDSASEETTRFDFPELLRTIADDYGDQGIDVPYHGPLRMPFRGRPFALKRAFTNLIDNAAKYATPPDITLQVEEESICIFVRDLGPGIPEGEAEQLFAPFYRLERSRNRATGGVGLGLTAARAAISSHGGNIVLRNRRGGGLEVQVLLPQPVDQYYTSKLS